MKQQQQRQSPSWVFSLLSEKFFTPCVLHESSKKNEKNVFCLDCCNSICSHCFSLHSFHRLLQVRRYVYHDVIRLEDIEKLFDCGFVQPYTTNSAKVIFINQRPQSRPFKGSASVCNTCERSLQQPYHFCSLSCKVEYLVRYEGCISRYLYDCEYLPLSDVESPNLEALDDGQMTPISVLDDGIPLRSSSGSGSSGGVGCRNLWCTATTENVRRKKRSATQTWISRNALRRSLKRKGVPLRSPLF